MTARRVAFLYLDGLAPGGYPRDMRWLAGALTDLGVRVSVLARPGPELDGLGRAEVLTDGSAWRDAVRGSDVLHAFGFSEPAQLRAILSLRRAAPVTVVSPLVHLMAEHVRVKAWKKRPAYLLAGALLGKRVRYHFFSEVERREAQRILRASRTFIAPVGLFPATTEPAEEPGAYLLFFGRNDIHQKGLDRLLDGYEIALGRGLDIPLVIGGRAHADSERYLARAATRPKLGGRLRIQGAMDEDARERLMRDARAFVFLSRWDGPPRPVREALAVGVPALVSRGTNMTAIVRAHGAGIEVGDNPSEIAAALLETADDEKVRAWRAGTLSLREDLTWAKVARQYLAGYGFELD